MNTHLYSITLDKLVDELQFEEIYMPLPAKEINITNREVNRPGLALAGFLTVFERTRIQIIGRAEMQYLFEIGRDLADSRLDAFFAQRPVAVIITTNFEVGDEILSPAKKYGVPILRTKEKTSPTMSTLIASLNTHLANRITQHGVLVEVFGEGVLILGDSGIGKSETAIALVERGHRLIADDAVEIKRVSSKTLVGTAPEIIRHYVELRGIGIVDVRRIFGMGSVKMSEKVDMIVKLEAWDKNKVYDRIGLETETTNILGLDIVTQTIPVRPGRNLAIILEIAAMNNRQRKMGFNTAEEFNQRMMEQMFAPKDTDED